MNLLGGLVVVRFTPDFDAIALWVYFYGNNRIEVGSRILQNQSLRPNVLTLGQNKDSDN